MFTWNVPGSGNWNNPNNWTPQGFPNAVGDVAVLGGVITANRTITIPDGVSITIGKLLFQDDNNYTIASGSGQLGQLVFNNSNNSPLGGTASLEVVKPIGASSGSHSISARVNLVDNLQVTVASGGPLDLSGIIVEGAAIGHRGLSKDGSGTLRLSGIDANTYAGPTTVEGGYLMLNKGSGMPAGELPAFSGDLIVGGGTGNFAAVQHMLVNNIPFASKVTVNAGGFYILNGLSQTVATLTVAGGTVNVDTGQLTVTTLSMTGGLIFGTSGALHLKGDATINASTATATISMTSGDLLLVGFPARLFTVNSGAVLNISAPVHQSSTVISTGLVKSGPGTMRLGGPGTFSGGVTLNDGTLLVGDDAALGTSTATFTINGGTIQADGGVRTLANPVSIAGNFTVAGSNNLRFNGAAILKNGDRIITVGDPVSNISNTTFFFGVIGQEPSFSRGLTKSGPGTLDLAGADANTYTGKTTVLHGVLQLDKMGVNAFGGDLEIGDGLESTGTAVAFHTQTNTIPDTAKVTVNGPDGLYLQNGNEAFGPLVVNGGAVNVGLFASVTSLTMTGGSITNGSGGGIQLGGDVTVKASATGSTITGGQVLLGNVSRVFTVEHGTAVDLGISSHIPQQGGTVGLIKAGPGTMRLEGPSSNSYTGPTTVNAGTLELNKSQPGAVTVAVSGDLTINGGVVRELLPNQIDDGAAITVNVGGTFDLNGQSDAVGKLTVTGGTVRTAGGSSAGQLTAGNTSFDAAATLVMKLTDEANSDRITVNGTVVVGGALQLSPGSAVAPGTAITLIVNDGTDMVQGTFSVPDGFAVSNFGGTPPNDVVLSRPLAVQSVTIDDGSAQRSMVRSVRVTFAAPVTFTGQPAAAFQLSRTGPGQTGNVALSVDLAGSTATLHFSGPLTEGSATNPSLIDGNYTLTILSNQIQGGLQGGDNVSTLFRLFGDVNGDKAVNGLDLTAFRNAFGSVSTDANYAEFLDFNGDGAINGADLSQFRSRFGAVLP